MDSYTQVQGFFAQLSDHKSGTPIDTVELPIVDLQIIFACAMQVPFLILLETFRVNATFQIAIKILYPHNDACRWHYAL